MIPSFYQNKTVQMKSTKMQTFHARGARQAIIQRRLHHPRPPQKTRREPQARKLHHPHPLSTMTSAPFHRPPLLPLPHSPLHPLMPPTQTPPLSPTPIPLMSLQLPPPPLMSLYLQLSLFLYRELSSHLHPFQSLHTPY